MCETDGFYFNTVTFWNFFTLIQVMVIVNAYTFMQAAV